MSSTDPLADPLAAAIAARAAWRDLGAAVLAFLAMPLFAAPVLGLLSADDPAGGGEIEIGPILAAQFAASLVVTFLAFRLRTPGPRGGGAAGAVLRYLLFLIGFVPLAFILLPWLWQSLGLPLEPQEHLVWFLGDHPLGLWTVGLLTVTVVGPLYEEVVFRGYLLRGLQQFLGDHGAVWMSAFLFGLGHAGSGWFLVLPLTLLGAFLGALRLRYRGLVAPVAVHMVHNALVLAVALTVPQSLDAVYRSGG